MREQPTVIATLVKMFSRKPHSPQLQIPPNKISKGTGKPKGIMSEYPGFRFEQRM